MAKENIVINMDNLKPEEREQLFALIEKANQPKELWKPNAEEKYYYMYGTGEIIDDKNYGRIKDFDRFKIGNVFPTEEAAEFAVERLKVIHELRKISGGFNPIKSQESEYYSLAYNFSWKEIEPMNHYGAGYYFVDIYFETEEDAKRAIKEIGYDRLKKYWFCM